MFEILLPFIVTTTQQIYFTLTWQICWTDLRNV